MTEKTLSDLQKLNRISLTENEQQSVLEFYSFLGEEEKKLEKINTEGLVPMVHLTDRVNVLREDKAYQPFTRDELQEGAPEQTDGYWQVPRLVD